MNLCLFFEGTGQVVEKLFPGRHSDVGGLYDDNHLVADLALAWIAARAKREGLRFKRGARLSQKLDISAVALHDSHDEVSSLWGACGEGRTLAIRSM